MTVHKLDNKGVVTKSHSRTVKETEISKWEVPDFFLKLTLFMNKSIETWSKSRQLPYANEENFWPIMV